MDYTDVKNQMAFEICVTIKKCLHVQTLFHSPALCLLHKHFLFILIIFSLKILLRQTFSVVCRTCFINGRFLLHNPPPKMRPLHTRPNCYMTMSADHDE